MPHEFMIEKVLNSSILIFTIYICFATLICCLAYFINEIVQEMRERNREESELLTRSEEAENPIVDDIYS